MQNNTLLAGAGQAQICLPEELFPTEGFTGVHDSLQIRALLLESGTRIAILSIELTSLPEDIITALQKLVGESANISPENVLICATHTFSAPHFLPKHLCKTPLDQFKNSLLFQTISTAVQAATLQAVSKMQKTRFGCEHGLCDVNVNRDISTEKGWWLGSNETGPSDKTVTVLRFETLDHTPIALLYSYAVQPSIMDGAVMADGGHLVTADISGAASRFIENEYGDTVTAIFCLGAAGNQAPALKAKTQYVGEDGVILVEDIHEQGFTLVEMLGKRLGMETVRIAESMQCHPVNELITKEKHMIKLPGQQMPVDIHSLHPTTQFNFLPAEERTEPVEVVKLADIALIGVRPELTSETAAKIKEQSPFANTIVLTMVNGGAKYMANSSAYDRITYEAMNSPFARGSAELLCEKVLEILRR